MYSILSKKYLFDDSSIVYIYSILSKKYLLLINLLLLIAVLFKYFYQKLQ